MSYEFAGGYKIRDQNGLYFLTFTVVGWIDLFSRKVYRDILISNMQYCMQEKNLAIGAYVIMTNHMHCIWQQKVGNLSDTLRDFKSYSTKKMMQAIERENESRRNWLQYMFEFYAAPSNKHSEYKMWTGDNHPEEITSEKFLRTKLNYIHENPVRAGFVENPEHYVYSSASNYISGKGRMEIDYLF